MTNTAILDAHWKSVTRGVFRLTDGLFIILDIPAILKFQGLALLRESSAYSGNSPMRGRA